MPVKRYSARNALERIQKIIDHMHEMFHAFAEGQTHMSKELDRLTTEVAEMKTVNTSAVNLLRRLATMIRENANNPAALTALADDLNASESDLAAAVAENTPAEEEPTEEPTPDEN